MNKFSKRLKELRLDKGISVTKLAEETGIGSSSLYRWENGEADIFSNYLIILANYFSVSTDYLLGLVDFK